MSRVVFKYAVPELEDEFVLQMQQGAEVLCVQAQFDRANIWALVDPAALIEPRRFHLRGTGHPIDAPGRYVGTFQLGGGRLVLHLFEAAQ